MIPLECKKFYGRERTRWDPGSIPGIGEKKLVGGFFLLFVFGFFWGGGGER